MAGSARPGAGHMAGRDAWSPPRAVGSPPRSIHPSCTRTSLMRGLSAARPVGFIGPTRRTPTLCVRIRVLTSSPPRVPQARSMAPRPQAADATRGGSRKRARILPTGSAYAGARDECGTARTGSACLQTAYCPECTASARCGACRNVYSRMEALLGHGCDATMAPGAAFESGGFGPGSILLLRRQFRCAAALRPPFSTPNPP